MKKWIQFVLGISIVLLLIILSMYFTRGSKINNPEYTIGTIVRIRQDARGASAIVKFKVKSKTYKSSIGTSADSNDQIGKKFKVVYEKDNPNENYILTFAPIFTNNDLKRETVGTVTQIFRSGFTFSSKKFTSIYVVRFTYFVNGIEYNRAQSLPREYKQKFPQLKDGKKYKVEYSIKNPKIVIIHLKTS